jgi:hypothetical protein
MVVVRFYNTTESDISNAAIKLKGAFDAKLLNLNEEVIGDAAFKDETVTIDSPSKKIITLGFVVE